MAPVWAGAALLGMVAVAAVVLAAEVMELTWEAEELVSDPRAEVMESKSEPVAVASSDEKDEMRLAASLLMELSSEVTADVMDEITELVNVDSELERDEMELKKDESKFDSVLVKVTTVVWA